MLIKEVASVLFIFSMILGGISVHLFKLKKRMAIYRYCLCFVALEYYLISDSALYHSLLPLLALESFSWLRG